MPNLRDLNEELRSIQDQIFHLKRCLNFESWMTIGYSFAEDEWDEWEEELEASHEQHPKAWNKLYYARMHGRLPREIRDMINTAIWDDDYGRTEEGAEVAWRAMGTTLGALHPKRISHISHVVLPEYVGAEAALENIQMWYEITARICPTRFQLDGMKIGERLKTTLCKDSFQIGLNPATVLRTLAICLDDTELILGHKHSAFKDAISRRDAFDCLLRIKKKSGLQLSFQICQDSIRLNLLPEIFDLLRPVVEVFEHAGAHVRVFTTYSPFYSNSADDEGVNIHTDIKHLVRSYDPATWKPAMIEYFDEFDEDALKSHHRHYRGEDRPGYDPDLYPMERFIDI